MFIMSDTGINTLEGMLVDPPVSNENGNTQASANGKIVTNPLDITDLSNTLSMP